MTCKVAGCDNEVLARGLCSTHYQQARRKGKLETGHNTTVLSRPVRKGVTCHLGRFVDRESRESGLTKKRILEAIAEACDSKFDTINMVYRAHNLPSLPLALKIAKYLNVPVEELFTLDEE